MAGAIVPPIDALLFRDGLKLLKAPIERIACNSLVAVFTS